VQKLLRWALRVPPADRHLTTLLCFPNETGGGFEAFYIMQGVEIGTRYNITGPEDPLLRRGRRLKSLADLSTVGRDAFKTAAEPSAHCRRA
jgi:hypothetical protein